MCSLSYASGQMDRQTDRQTYTLIAEIHDTHTVMEDSNGSQRMDLRLKSQEFNSWFGRGCITTLVPMLPSSIMR